MGQARKKAEQAPTTEEIQATYGEIRDAFVAWRDFAGGRMNDGGQPLSTRMPFKTVLKGKRLLSTLRPFIEQANEVVEELQAKHGIVEGEQPSLEVVRAFDADVKQTFKVRVPVTCEPMRAEDFELAGNVSSTLIGVLDSLGPFFRE